MLNALLILTAASLSAHAGDPAATAAEYGRGFHATADVVIDAPVDVVWAHYTEDFAAIADWHGGIETSRAMTAAEVPEGYAVDPDAPMPGRVVVVDGKTQSQTLTDWDAGARTFTFRAGDLPFIMNYAHNTHVFTATDDGRTRVSVDVTLVPAGPLKLFGDKIADKFSGYMDGYLAAGKTALEQRDGVAQLGDR